MSAAPECPARVEVCSSEPVRECPAAPPCPAPVVEPALEAKPKGKIPRGSERKGKPRRESGWHCFEVLDNPNPYDALGFCWRDRIACDAIRAQYRQAKKLSPCEEYALAFCYTEYDPRELYSVRRCYMSLEECAMVSVAAKYQKPKRLRYRRCGAIQ